MHLIHEAFSSSNTSSSIFLSVEDPCMQVEKMYEIYFYSLSKLTIHSEQAATLLRPIWKYENVQEKNMLCVQTCYASSYTSEHVMYPLNMLTVL